MQPRVNLFIKLKSFLPLLALLAMLPLLIRSEGVGAATFNPVQTARLADPSLGANSDIITSFDLPAGDANFAALISFTPDAFKVPSASDLPIGTVVAELKTRPSLGLLNGPCVLFLPVDFTFINASVNINDTIDPKAPGQPDPLAPLAFDGDANGIEDGAEKWPSYLNLTFENQTPRARYFGATFIQSASTTVILNLVIFQPGTSPVPSVVPAIDARLGYPTVTVLQNPETDPSPGPITDFCSSLESDTTIFGLSRDNPNTAPDESGKVVRQNPTSDGTFNLELWARSLRDADGDGLENNFDTCPFVANVQDPRQSAPTGDPDFDGIDSACDPDPSGLCGPGAGDDPQGSDCDFDEFLNRGDNCPLVANGIRAGTIIGPNNQKDTDEDAIGDACDTAGSGPNVADGARNEMCSASAVSVGAGGPAPSGSIPLGDVSCPPTSVAGTGTGGTVDTDGDGVPDATDRCANTPAGATVDQFGCTAAQAVLDDDKDGVLNASDSCPGTAAGASVDAKGCSAAQLASGGGGTGGDSGTGGPDTGVGALAPVVGSIPAWAAIASGLGGAGLLGSLTALASRVIRRRH